MIVALLNSVSVSGVLLLLTRIVSDDEPTGSTMPMMFSALSSE
jgi:hypothetical protein